MLVVMGCLAVERTYHFGFLGTDDANIFFRFARNLVAGYGTVYNPHAEPVEGFTSTLWFVICVYAQIFGPYSVSALLVLNVLLAAASLSLIVLYCNAQLRSLALRPPLPAIGFVVGALALLHPAWFLWNVTSLMDAGLYAFCITLAWSAVELLRRGSARAPVALGVATSLLVLCRPEGLGWFLVLLVTTWLVGKLMGVPRVLRGRALRTLFLGGTISAGSLLGWRILTFHSALPNPLYAKVSAPWAERLHGGIEHALSYLRIQPVLFSLALMLPVAAFALRRLTDGASEPGTLCRRRRARSVLVALFVPLLWVFAGWMVPILAGGDVFGGHRFFQAVYLLLIPPVVLGAGLLAQTLLPANGRLVAYAVTIVVLCHAAVGHWRDFAESNKLEVPTLDLSEHMATEFLIAQADRAHGKNLAALFGTFLPRIAYAAAGGIAVGYPGTVYDMMGLNDPEVAKSCKNKTGPIGHACFDRNRFFALAPDALLPRAIERTAPLDLAALDRELRRNGNWDNTIFHGLFSDPEFRSKYRLVKVLRRTSSWAAYGYFSVPFLFELAAHPDFQLEYAN